MASLYDYKIRESMNAFRFDAVTKDIFLGTLKILVYLFVHAEMQKLQKTVCACINVKS